MAELCRECFIETWHPYMKNTGDTEEDIVMSEDSTVCEGCGKFLPYVHHVGKFKDFDDGVYDNIQKDFEKYISSVSYAMMKKRHNPNTDIYRGDLYE